jgi:hypothetical protein
MLDFSIYNNLKWCVIYEINAQADFPSGLFYAGTEAACFTYSVDKDTRNGCLRPCAGLQSYAGWPTEIEVTVKGTYKAAKSFSCSHMDIPWQYHKEAVDLWSDIYKEQNSAQQYYEFLEGVANFGGHEHIVKFFVCENVAISPQKGPVFFVDVDNSAVTHKGTAHGDPP